MRLLCRSVGWVAACLSGAAGALAQDADFYRGKTIQVICGFAPGGGYDLYGRLVAEFMQKYLPGSTFVVKNVPGAGHLVGTNTIYASKPDGLTIGTFNTGLIYNQLIGLDGVKFDLNKMSWIGKASSDPRMFTVHPDVPIKSFKELQDWKGEPLTFSTAGVGSAAYVETAMLAKALKPSAGEILLQGENILSASEDRLRELRCTRMSMIFQEPMTALNPVMTCGEQIDEVLNTHTDLDPAARKASA